MNEGIPARIPEKAVLGISYWCRVNHCRWLNHSRDPNSLKGGGHPFIVLKKSGARIAITPLHGVDIDQVLEVGVQHTS